MIPELSAQRISIDKCRKVFEDYARNVSWTRKNYNYVFYLPDNECLIEVDSSDLKSLFIASSFVMPLDTKAYLETYEEFKKEIILLEATVETFENIKSELDKFKESQAEIEKLKKDLNEREVKSIETLSIFTVIVTFVFASAVEFKFIVHVSQAILFTLCFSLSLSFFVFLIMLTRTNVFMETIRKYVKGIILILLFIFFLWFLLVYEPDIKTYLASAKVSVNKQVDKKISDKALSQHGSANLDSAKKSENKH